MRTRQETVQAYKFLTRRIVSGLLSGEPETTDRPMRRFGMAMVGSAMVATIVFAVVGVIGFLRPSGGTLSENVIAIERETGARYVYLNGTLYPVLNFTSARLIAGAAAPTVQTVSRESLRDLPRGEPVGIPDAPDALPDAAALVGLPWSTCTMRRSTGSAALVTHLQLGAVPAGGTDLGTRALLVSAGTGDDATLFLLWNGHRLKIANRAGLAALGLSAVTPIPVGLPLLNSITVGPDLLVPTIPNIGDESGTVDGRPGVLGQVYGYGSQYFTLLESGLTPISEVMARLMQANRGGTVVTISANAAGNAQANTFEPAGFPQTLPKLYDYSSEPPMICGTYTAGASVTEPVAGISVYDAVDPTMAAASANLQRRSADGVRLADRVAVPGGRGALVRVLPAPGATTTSTTTYLITDQGIKYALPTEDTATVQANLGLGTATPTLVPSYLLALIPTGATLDPDDAKQFVTPATAASPTPSAGT
ncbi:type VII secretion protein EccB [Actinoplanes sp. NPDC051851]|uniref:type VII secretion protein EccB n=1 Tax=Actinoplanes sp. NPDC051851 TaxID=3154753 RepID=UPI003420EA66